MPTYTHSQLKSDVNAKIKGKIDVLVDYQSTLNQGVRQVLSDLDLRTTRRRTALTPNLFSGIFEYAAPTDLKKYGIITVQNQVWDNTPDWSLVPYEQFMRRQDNETIAISDYDFTRKIYIKSDVDDDEVTLASFNSTTADGGTWSSFGDSSTVTSDSDNYVAGSGSVRFDINADGGTTAGLQNTALSSTDISNYLNGNGSATVWAYISDKTNITNFILRVGSSASDYYSKTVTTQSDGTAFVNGWNLLRFDLTSLSETGSVTDTAIDYLVLYMTKDAAKVSETGYRFDDLVLHVGENNNLYYYSFYGWQNTSGTYLENTTATTDYLNAETDEYEIILTKCSELAAEEVDEDRSAERYNRRYKELIQRYKLNHPSEALIMISTTADFLQL